MTNNNGNGKWQLAFWVVTVICGIWLLVLTKGVIANDVRIETKGDVHYDAVAKDISSIKVSIARIEEKMCGLADKKNTQSWERNERILP